MTRDAEHLAGVLADDATWTRVLRSAGEAAVGVSALRDLAARKRLNWTEEQLDELVAELGGRREPLLDPWSWPKRMVLWLLGHKPQTNDLYVFPRGVVAGIQARPAPAGQESSE